jgi:hypothetical protein
MYALSLGVQRIDEILPGPVYALLSGLNASTVGIIALAAVQLAEKAIRDKLTRILVILGACAGLCYNALWYFPLLIFLGGLSTVIWDGWLSQKIGILRTKLKRKRVPENIAEETLVTESIPLEERPVGQNVIQRRNVTADTLKPKSSGEGPQRASADNLQLQPDSQDGAAVYTIRMRVGTTITVLFFGM